MKKTLFFLLIIMFTTIAFADITLNSLPGTHSGIHNPGTRDVLYDQTSSPTADGVSAAQDFVDPVNESYDCWGADDFEIPAGETWTIDSAYFSGAYFNGVGPGTGFGNMKIYQDATGMPGTELFDLPACSVVDDGLGNLDITLTTPVVLTEGVYWMAWQQTVEYAVGGQWGVQPHTATYGSVWYWINPGGGFGSGTDWLACTAMWPANVGTDLTYAIYGTVGGGGPANDFCGDAEVVGEVTDYPFDTSTATASGFGAYITSNDLWYVFTPTFDGVMTVDLCDSSFDTKLAIYGECDPGTLLDSNDDSSYCTNMAHSAIEDLDVVNGEDYYIQVGGYSSNNGAGDLTIVFTPAEIPYIQIGDGTVISQSLPIEPYYGYSWSNVIYLANDINTSGDITGLQYQYQTTAGFGDPDAIEIYIGHTTQSDFIDGGDWIDVTTMTQVFNGALTFPPATGDWITITLDTPFTYNGTDNLVIAWDENTTGYHSGSDEFFCTGTTPIRGICYYNDSTNPDPFGTLPTANAVRQAYPNVRLNGLVPTNPPFAPENPVPADMAVDINEGTDIEWTGTADAFYVYLWDDVTETMIVDGEMTLNHFFDIPGNLDFNTLYHWRIDAENIIGTTIGTEWAFTTRPTPTMYTIPYLESFDTNVLPAEWIIDPVVSGDSWEFWTSQSHGADSEHTGNAGYFMGVDDSSPETVPSHLYSPYFDLTGAINPYLNFWYWIGDTATESTLNIDINDGTTVTVDVFVAEATIDHWAQGCVNLVPWIDQNIIVDFRAMESASFYGDICLDDIELVEVPFGSLEGYVYDGAAVPLEMAEVTYCEFTVYTDATGWYSMPIVPAGTGDAVASLDGYFDDVVNVTIVENQVTTQDFYLDWAEIAIAPMIVDEWLLPDDTMDITFDVTNNGTGDLTYNTGLTFLADRTYHTQYKGWKGVATSSPYAESTLATSDVPHKKTINSSDAIWDLQFAYDVDTPSGLVGLAGAETDGTYFYVTKWSASSDIAKFDMQGNFIEIITIPGVTSLRDLAYDGQYFYGSNASSYIWEMDFDTQTLISTITTPASVRAIAYDEVNDGFWYNNFATDLQLVDRTGTVLNTIAAPPSMYGCAYDNLTAGGPYLWIFTGTSTGAGCQVEQFDLNTLTLTGVTHDVDADLSGGAGAYIAGGLFLHPDLIGGTYTLGGLAQGTPDLLFGYELGVTETWLTISDPGPGVVAPGATETFTATLDATDLENGDLKMAEIIVGNNAITGMDEIIPVTMNVGEAPLIVQLDPLDVPYWTGTTDGTTFTSDSEVRGYNIEDGWMMFDTSAIPAGAVVTNIEFYGFVNNNSWPYWAINGLDVDPLTGSAVDVYASIQTNEYNYFSEGGTIPLDWYVATLGGTSVADMNAAIAQGWFGLGIMSDDNSTYYYINFDGWNETNPPYLLVTYEEGVAPEPPAVIFSEYIEGSSNNKALEIWNASGDVVNLDCLRIAQSVNGGDWAYWHTFPAGATLADQDVWVILNADTDPLLFDPLNADEVLTYPSVVHHNGDDARGLEWTPDGGTTWILIDVIGIPTEDPGAGWDVAGVTEATANHTLYRKDAIMCGNTDWALSAGTNETDSEWIVYDQNTFEYLGQHPSNPVVFDPPENVMVDEVTALVTWDAPAVIISEDCFDTYTPGDFLGVANPTLWTTWSNLPGGSEDVLVSDAQSSSPDNSILVQTNNDCVMIMNDYTSGVYSIEMDMFVPTGFGGYFNLQKTSVPGTEWAFELMLNDDGSAVANAGANAALSFTYAHDVWMNMRLEVDLDTDWCDFYVDDTFMIGYQWTLGSGGTAGLLQFGGMNIFGGGCTGTPMFYFDNVVLQELVPPTDALIGYNVWLDGDQQNTALVTDLEYQLDTATLVSGTSYTAGVSAVYDDPGESEVIDYVFTYGGVVLDPPTDLFVTEQGYATWVGPVVDSVENPFSLNASDIEMANTKVSSISNTKTRENAVIEDTRAFLGFNVYLDGGTPVFVTDEFYQYTGLTNGTTYLAEVTALYDEGESVPIDFEFIYNDDIFFFDDFEAGGDNWVFEGTWGLTEEDSYSPTHSLTESPDALYGPDLNISCTLASAWDLSSFMNATLAFWYKPDIETAFDYMYLEITTDGTTWLNLATYDEEDGEWQAEEIALGGFVGPGNETVSIRFRFESDGGYETVGMLIDDILVTTSMEDTAPPFIVHEGPAFYEGTPDDFVFTADIIDVSGIASANVIYTLDEVDEFTLPYTSVTGDTYTFTIPAQDAGVQVDYSIEATDASANSNVGLMSGFVYIAGTPFIYDNGVVDFYVVFAEGTGAAELIINPAGNQLNLAYALIRNYTDQSGQDNDDFEFHVWADNNGLPGADLITPFVVTPEATYSNTSAMTRVDLRGYAAELEDIQGNFFVGFLVNQQGPEGHVHCTESQPNNYTNSYTFDGTSWALYAGNDLHFRAVAELITMTTGTVEGVVTNADTGNPIVGATVTIGTVSDVTIADGSYSIIADPGIQDVVCEADDYEVFNGSVEVLEGETVTFDIALDMILWAPENLTYQYNDPNVLLQWDAPSGGGGGEIEELIYDNGTNTGAYSYVGYSMGCQMSPSEACQILTLKIHTSDGADFNAEVWGWDAGAPTEDLYYQENVNAVLDDWVLVDVSGENLMFDGDFVVAFGSLNATTYMSYDAGLNNGRAWDHADAGGWSSWSEAYLVRAIVQYGDGRIAEISPTPVKTNKVVSRVLESGERINMDVVDHNVDNLRELTGYNVYRDGEVVANVVSEFYLDLDVPAGTYTYYVTAVYVDPDGESEASNEVVVEVPTFGDDILKPTVTELTGNYPNPFNPTTTISFSLKEAGHVSINIYNMRGQLVKTLVNAEFENDYYEIVWDGRDNSGKNTASGIYFYKMKTQNYNSAKKMILMK